VVLQSTLMHAADDNDVCLRSLNTAC